MEAPEEKRCTAQSSQQGRRCRKYRVPGSTVCTAHGGMAPQVRTAAARRVAEDEVRRSFGRLADHAKPVEDPLTALSEIAGHVVAWERFCAQQIADLQTFDVTDAKGTEQVRAVVSMFERSMAQATDTLSRLAKSGIEERMARINEMQAQRVLRAVQAGFDQFGDVGRDPRLRELASQAVAKELQAGG